MKVKIASAVQIAKSRLVWWFARITLDYRFNGKLTWMVLTINRTKTGIHYQECFHYLNLQFDEGKRRVYSTVTP